MNYDVTLILAPLGPGPATTASKWRGDYDSVWKAIEDAQERAERLNAEVRGIHAMRVNPESPERQRGPSWQCGCGLEVPSWLLQCDVCGGVR